MSVAEANGPRYLTAACPGCADERTFELLGPEPAARMRCLQCRTEQPVRTGPVRHWRELLDPPAPA